MELESYLHLKGKVDCFQYNKPKVSAKLAMVLNANRGQLQVGAHFAADEEQSTYVKDLWSSR